MNRRFFLQIHSWVGVTCGLLMFLVCWSGTWAVLSHEIDWLLNPSLRAPVAAQPATWEELARGAERASPGAYISMLNRPPAPGFAAEAWIEARGSGQLQRVYLDPATGQAQGTWSFFNVQRWFRDFHMRLMWPDTGQWPYYIVASMAVALLVQIVAGLVFYRKWWTRLFVLRWNRGRPALMTDLHRLGGLWSLVFTPIVVVTGLWYLVERIDANTTELIRPPARTSTVLTTSDALPLNQLVARAQAAYPTLRIRTIQFPGSEEDPIAFTGQDGALLVRDAAARIELDPGNGAVTSIIRPDGLVPVVRWQETADRVHFGDWGGLASKAFYFLFGLMLSGLCLTGAYLHIMRASTEHPLSRGPIVWTAHLITIGLLGQTIYGGWNSIRDYGTQDAWPVFPPGVFIFLALWTLSTVFVLQWWARKVR